MTDAKIGDLGEGGRNSVQIKGDLNQVTEGLEPNDQISPNSGLDRGGETPCWQ